MGIPFVEYIRPSGRKQQRTLTLDEATNEMANKIIEAGNSFTAELLSDDLVSICIENGEEDIACRVFANGEGNLASHTREMVVETYERLFGRVS